MRIPALICASILTGCTTVSPGMPGEPSLPVAPWNAHAAVRAPEVVVDEWRKAGNRSTCAPMTIADPGDRARSGTARRANFSGGWGVAWDVAGLPGREPSGSYCATCGRGVFGIAGAGVEWGPGDDGAGFPNRIEWAGGNYATFGLEGMTGPNWLAQLRVAEQRCVYYVWSFLGREHLEHLLGQVRRVDE